MEEKNLITPKILDHYFDVTGRALKKVKINPQKKTIEAGTSAHDFLDMAQRYFDDASYFRKKGDFVNAFGALYYAHGWLDAGAMLGLFDVGKDNTLFTVDGD